MELKKNSLIELEIQDLGSEGEGIGRYEGFTFFVKNALPGDLILAKVIKQKKSYGYARIEKILISSQNRVKPVCPLFGRCGGCQLLHLAYPKQLEYKQKKVEACLKRIGKVEAPNLEEPVGMKNPYYYRNKAQFPVGQKEDGSAMIGFFAERSHRIVDVRHCFIQEPINDLLLECIRAFLDEYRISIYNETSEKGLVRHVLTRVGFTSKEVMVCLVLNGKKLPFADVLVERLLSVLASAKKEGQLYSLAGVCINVNQNKTNVILGSELLICFGRGFLYDFIGDVKFQISPLSFFQVNPLQTKCLYDTVLELADLNGNEVVYDLYCGIGTISLYLAKHVSKVIGIEIVPEAIIDAKVNAQLNGILNAEFFIGSVEQLLPKMLQQEQILAADVVVLDPPRKGCEISLLEALCLLNPKKIVYVSCDPATLSRDVAWLSQKGYALEKGRVFDQFAQSVHVETVALLTRKAQ